MRTGRPRKPTSTLKLHGTMDSRQAKQRRSEPQAAGMPTKPDGMPKEASEFWDKYVPELVRMGVAKANDAPALQSMCQWWAEYMKHQRSRPASKHVYRRINMMANAHKQWRDLASRFGMTPVDRTHIQVDDRTSKDPADEYLA